MIRTLTDEKPEKIKTRMECKVTKKKQHETNQFLVS